MSGGGIAGRKTTNHRRYTNAATLMREMPASKLEADENQHNTEIGTNKTTISFLCLITTEEEDEASCKLEEEENKSFVYNIQ